MDAAQGGSTHLGLWSGLEPPKMSSRRPDVHAGGGGIEADAPDGVTEEREPLREGEQIKWMVRRWLFNSWYVGPAR